jgi:hypothetical protein
VDEVGTSDDLLLNLMEGRELVGVRFTQRKRLLDRFTNSAAESADRLLLRWLQRGQNRCCKQKREAYASRFALIDQVIFLRKRMRQVFKHVKHGGAFRGR